MIYKEYSDHLEHFGVLGMKWGIRKDRSAASTARATARAEEKAVKKQRKQTMQARRLLSEGKLKEAIARLENERKLKDLTKADLHPGMTMTQNIMTNIGRSAITAAGAAVGTYAIKAAMEGKFDIKEAAKFIRPKK